MAIDLAGGIEKLEEIGVYDVILPFLLIFILVFAILEKVKIFGDQSTKFDAIIALVIGILLVRQGDLVLFINNYLPNVSAVIVVFLGILILLGLFGVGAGGFKGGILVAFVIVSLIGGIWALTQATEQGDMDISIPWVGEYEVSEEDAGSLVIVGVFVLILIVALGLRTKKKGFEGFLDGISKAGDSFGGVGRP